MSSIKVGEEFINQVATKAVQKQIVRSIRFAVQEIIRDLMVQLFGSGVGRRVKRKLGSGVNRRVTDLKKFVSEQLESAMVTWIRGIMDEETGGSLVEYVMERVSVDEEDEDDDEEDEEEY